MAKMTIGQKAERLLKLLLGLRNPRVVEALKQYGFSDKDLNEGWRVLQALTHGRLSQRAPTRQDPALLQRLDEWENRWFPVASASLKGRFPDVYEWLFLNLSQTEGAAVVISVGTFVSRLEAMSSEPTLGARGAEARQLLTTRGFNAANLKTATGLLEELTTTAPAEPAPSIDPAQAAAQEEAMWRWYLEWGEIARIAVTDRRLLRELGFLNQKRPISDDDGSVEPEAAEV